MFFSTYFRSLSASKKIALLAVFIALSIVVNCFSIDVTASNKIAFTYVVCFFAGYLMGGVPAFFIAFLGDAIGYLANPSGVYWLFGLTLGVYALMMGMIMNVKWGEKKSATYLKTILALIIGYLFVTVLLNSAVNYWYVRLFLWGGEAKKTFWVYLGGRLAFQSVVYAVNAALCVAIVPVLLKVDEQIRRRKQHRQVASASDGKT